MTMQGFLWFLLGAICVGSLLTLLLAPADIRSRVFHPSTTFRRKLLAWSILIVIVLSLVAEILNDVLSLGIRVLGVRPINVSAIYIFSVVCARAAYLWWKLRIAPTQTDSESHRV
jgi:hypothetical protein